MPTDTRPTAGIRDFARQLFAAVDPEDASDQLVGVMSSCDALDAEVDRLRMENMRLTEIVSTQDEQVRAAGKWQENTK